MAEQDLQQLVEKIVKRVMARFEADPELAQHLKKHTDSNKETWARTCSSYRGDETGVDQEQSFQQTTPATSKKLYTERDILELAKSGKTLLVVNPKTIITPAARDAAERKGIEIKTE